MAERDWFDALLGEYDDFNLPPACPFGQEDYAKDAEQDHSDLATEDTSIFEESLATTAEKLSDGASKPIDATCKPTVATCKPIVATCKPTEAAHKPTNATYKPTDATGVKSTDKSIYRSAGIQPEGPEVCTASLTTATISVPTKPQHIIPNSPTQVAEPANYHGYIAPDPATVAHTNYPDPHPVRPAALPTGHPNSDLGAMNIPSSVHHDQKHTPAVLPAVKSKGQAYKEPLLAPIDYGVPCGDCKNQSIWQPGATFCFDCLGNSPSERIRQEVIARAMLGIWSCTNCYHEADNGAGRHCQSCNQRQVAKNARARQRKAAGETWVPQYVQNGGIRKPKVEKPKVSSKASQKAKIAAIKKGLSSK